MRPVPIPDELVPDGCRRIVVGAPGGDLTDETVGAVEVVAGVDPQMGLGQAVLLQLEDGDLDRLQDCGGLWLTLYTRQLPVFAVEIADGNGS